MVRASHRSSDGYPFNPRLGIRSRFSEIKAWRTYTCRPWYHQAPKCTLWDIHFSFETVFSMWTFKKLTVPVMYTVGYFWVFLLTWVFSYFFFSIMMFITWFAPWGQKKLLYLWLCQFRYLSASNVFSNSCQLKNGD